MQIFHVSAGRVDLTVGIVMIASAIFGLLGGGEFMAFPPIRAFPVVVPRPAPALCLLVRIRFPRHARPIVLQSPALCLLSVPLPNQGHSRNHRTLYCKLQ